MFLLPPIYFHPPENCLKPNSAHPPQLTCLSRPIHQLPSQKRHFGTIRRLSHHAKGFRDRGEPNHFSFYLPTLHHWARRMSPPTITTKNLQGSRRFADPIDTRLE